jgi:hypothetical protein
LHTIADKLAQGDVTSQIAIHGEQMPGLARLRQATPEDWKIAYRDLPNGGEIRFSSPLPDMVAAIHQYFDAQLSDHGHHAMPHHPHGTP